MALVALARRCLGAAALMTVCAALFASASEAEPRAGHSVAYWCIIASAQLLARRRCSMPRLINSLRGSFPMYVWAPWAQCLMHCIAPQAQPTALAWRS